MKSFLLHLVSIAALAGVPPATKAECILLPNGKSVQVVSNTQTRTSSGLVLNVEFVSSFHPINQQDAFAKELESVSLVVQQQAERQSIPHVKLTAREPGYSTKALIRAGWTVTLKQTIDGSWARTNAP